MVWAQVPATRLEGIIQDASENPIAGAMITATYDQTGWFVQAQSDSLGHYAFPALRPGIYTVLVEAKGYRPAAHTKVMLEGTGSLVEQFTLEPGGSTEAVTQAAPGERLKISESQISGVLVRRDLEILPQASHIPLPLSVFQPGIQIRGGDPAFSVVNGTGQGSNNLTLDGMEVNDPVDPHLGLSTLPTNLDSIEQFAIVTNDGKAEYGRNAGAQVIMVTRSGGTRWAGSAFDYFRNKALNANDFFNNSSNVAKPQFTQNIFGGSIGGPIVQDKTFIFGSYQGRHTTQDIIRNRTVLTDTAKTGVFQWYTPGTTTLNSFDIVKNDPRKLGIDPKMAALLTQLPEPNNTDIGDGLNTSGYRFNNPNSSDDDQVTVRADHSLSDNHRLFLRGSWARSSAVDSLNGADATYPGLPAGTSDQRQWGLSFGSDWFVSPTLTNQIRAGYTSGKISLDRPARAAGPMLLANSWTNPLDPSFAKWRNSPVIEVTDNLTLIRGSHSFKAGVNFRYTSQQSHDETGIYPNVTFTQNNGNAVPTSIGPSGISITPTDRLTFENLYNDLLGRTDQVTQTFYGNLQSFLPAGTARDRTFVFRDYGFFLQDDWKLKPNLTVNLGVRYELNGAPSESDSIQGALDKASSISSTANISDFTVVRGGALYNSYKTNFAPRVGFAWRPFDNTKTVVRGGVGIFYDRLTGSTTNLVDSYTPGTAQTVSLYPNLGGTDVRLRDTIPVPALPGAPALKLPNTRSTSIVVFQPDLRDPFVYHFHLTLERQVLRNTFVSLGYVGEQGKKLFMPLNLNQVKIGNGFLQAFQEIQSFRTHGTPVSSTNTLVKIFGSVNRAVTAIGGSVLDQGMAGTAAETVDTSYFARYAAAGVSDFYLKNYTQYDQFIVGTNNGTSRYDSVQASLRANRGPLKGYANYTWSKSRDNLSTDCSGCASPIDSFNAQASKSLSDGHRAEVLNAWVQYALPFGKGRPLMADSAGLFAWILGNWDLGIIAVRESGSPFSVTSGRQTARADIASYADYTGTLPKGAVSRETSGVYYFTPNEAATFTFPVAGDTGSTGRNAFIGPDYFTVDASLLKNIRSWGDRRRLTFRVEVYNAFNRANFGQLGTSLADSAGFAKFSSTQGFPRQIQAALRYEF
jgi:hypothetical protein